MSKSKSINAPSSNAAALTVIGGDDTGQINFDFAQVDENIAKRLSDEDLRDIFAIHRSREEPQKSKAYELFWHYWCWSGTFTWFDCTELYLTRVSLNHSKTSIYKDTR